jgi:hypothetical protein
MAARGLLEACSLVPQQASLVLSTAAHDATCIPRGGTIMNLRSLFSSLAVGLLAVLALTTGCSDGATTPAPPDDIVDSALVGASSHRHGATGGLFVVALSPADGTTTTLADLQLQAWASDLRDRAPLAYAWTDESGVFLGAGPALSAPSALSYGMHDVTVTVRDSEGRRTSATIHRLDVLPPNLFAGMPPLGDVLTFDTFGCLPYVPVEYVGTAFGGTPPYQYGWSVMPMQADEMTPNVAPIAIPLLSTTATTATISTAQFPVNWASDLAPVVYGPGEIVRLIFSVTDAVGSVSVSSAPMKWTCGPG